MSDPQCIGDLLKMLLAAPPLNKPLSAPLKPECPQVRLELLKPEHASIFFKLNDQELKEFFKECDADKEVILAKLEEVNNFPEVQEYWAIMAGADLAGCIVLKRSIRLQDLLYPRPAIQEGDLAYLRFLELSKEEQRSVDRKEQEEKLLIAPYCFAIVVHLDHRRKKIASSAFELLMLKAENRGIREIYLDIHQSDQKANKWAVSIGAEMIRSIDNSFYPAHIYRYTVAGRAIRH